MKTYSDQEKKNAESALPRTLVAFIHSQELAAAYAAVKEKSSLNLRQIGIVMETVGLALLGLEPESGVTESLHQAFPELDTKALSALLENINSAVFVEARKKLIREEED